MTSEEIAQAAADLATMQQLHAELDAAQSVIGGLRRALAAAQTERDTLYAELDRWRYGGQGLEHADVRQLAIDLLNQLTALRMPDESALWRYGGQGLERAYQALKKEVL